MFCYSYRASAVIAVVKVRIVLMFVRAVVTCDVVAHFVVAATLLLHCCYCTAATVLQ